jgi:hypothetical protein
MSSAPDAAVSAVSSASALLLLLDDVLLLLLAVPAGVPLAVLFGASAPAVDNVPICCCVFELLFSGLKASRPCPLLPAELLSLLMESLLLLEVVLRSGSPCLRAWPFARAEVPFVDAGRPLPGPLRDMSLYRCS